MVIEIIIIVVINDICGVQFWKVAFDSSTNG